jgi:predicted nucleotidyltransferase
MTQLELQEEIKSITQQLVEKYSPQKIMLFGSAAWGEFTPDSDIDFLIIKKDVPYYGIDRMRELDHLINYNIATDFLVYKPEEFLERLKLGDPFIKEIYSKGKVLYG